MHKIQIHKNKLYKLYIYMCVCVCERERERERDDERHLFDYVLRVCLT